MDTYFAEKNFWRFFWSTVLSIVGMDLYLFTHGWYLIELGGGKLSLGVSWAIFFLPTLLMLPACARLLKEYSVRRVQLSFEIAKASMLWVALFWLSVKPSIAAVYLLSAAFGFLFSPFYPATYALLKNLFSDNRIGKYSNLFEVSLQIAGAVALFSSGFLYENYRFYGIVFVSALAVTGSCFFLLRLEQVGSPSGKTKQPWLSTYLSFFSFPETRLSDWRFLAGLTHQIPQSAVLLLNIPLVVYVYQKMGGGPREYGYLDALYALSALGTSLVWSKWPQMNKRPSLLILSGSFSVIGFIALAGLPPSGVLPFIYIASLASALTSAKLIGRATYIENSPTDFVVRFTPFFQLVANSTLVLGAYFAGIVMEQGSVDAAMYCLAGLMAFFLVAFPLVQKRLRVSHVE